MPNIGRNASANSIGVLNRIDPPQSEMNRQVRMITDGIEMIIVVVWKNVRDRRAHAGQIHVVRPDDERQEADGQHRIDQRFVAPERLARVVGDDLADDAHRRQDQHVHLRMRRGTRTGAATAAGCRRR